MKIKISKSQWEEMGKKVGWDKTAQDKSNWQNPGPIERYIIKCANGMSDLRGGISRQNAAGQLANYAKLYYEDINTRVNVPD